MRQPSTPERLRQALLRRAAVEDAAPQVFSLLPGASDLQDDRVLHPELPLVAAPVSPGRYFQVLGVRLARFFSLQNIR